MSDTKSDRSVGEMARAFYDQEAAEYESYYAEDGPRYPANVIRLRHVLRMLHDSGAQRVLDVGCGSGFPLAAMLDEGFDAVGFDFSENMVAEAGELLGKRNHSADRVTVGNGEDLSSFPAGPFDAVVALGVFPHVVDEALVISNMTERLKPGGLWLAEFRNSLFSAFSLNRYSYDFYVQEFLSLPGSPSEDSNIGSAAREYLRSSFDVPEGTGNEQANNSPGPISYTSLLTRFHNPLSITDTLTPANLSWKGNTFYHFHAAPPAVESVDAVEFRRLSLGMEDSYSTDWRGNFLASAFLASAIKR